MITKYDIKPGKTYYFYSLEGRRGAPSLIQPGYITIKSITTRELTQREYRSVLWGSYGREKLDQKHYKYFISNVKGSGSWKGDGAVVVPKIKRFSLDRDDSLFSQNREEICIDNYTKFLRASSSKIFKIFDNKREAIEDAIFQISDSIDILKSVYENLLLELKRLEFSGIKLVSKNEYDQLVKKWKDTKVHDLNPGDTLWVAMNDTYSSRYWAHTKEDLINYKDVPPFLVTFEKWQDPTYQAFRLEEFNKIFYIEQRYYDSEYIFSKTEEDCNKLYQYTKVCNITKAIENIEGAINDMESKKYRLNKILEKDPI